MVGATRETEGIAILTTQPTVVGTACGEVELTEWFHSNHFRLLPGFSGGHPGSLSFYREMDQLAVFDAHPANFLRDRRGIFLPIDAVTVRADEELAALLEVMI